VALRDSSGLSAGEGGVEEWIRVGPGEHKGVAISPRATLRVESLPPGATVSTDSEYLGTAPVLIPREPGAVLRLRYPGFRDTLVTVNEVESSRLVIRLKPEVEGYEPLGFRPPDRKRPWYTKKWVRWGAPLLTLASGAAAVLLRQEANDAYDDYLGTGERRARERHFDRSKRLDRQSILSWVAAEVFFGFSFYSWIRSDEETERNSDLPGPVANRGGGRTP
jgi:hypothetical protein